MTGKRVLTLFLALCLLLGALPLSAGAEEELAFYLEGPTPQLVPQDQAASYGSLGGLYLGNFGDTDRDSYTYQYTVDRENYQDLSKQNDAGPNGPIVRLTLPENPGPGKSFEIVIKNGEQAVVARLTVNGDDSGSQGGPVGPGDSKALDFHDYVLGFISFDKDTDVLDIFGGMLYGYPWSEGDTQPIDRYLAVGVLKVNDLGDGNISFTFPGPNDHPPTFTVDELGLRADEKNRKNFSFSSNFENPVHTATPGTITVPYNKGSLRVGNAAILKAKPLAGKTADDTHATAYAKVTVNYENQTIQEEIFVNLAVFNYSRTDGDRQWTRPNNDTVEALNAFLASVTPEQGKRYHLELGECTYRGTILLPANITSDTLVFVEGAKDRRDNSLTNVIGGIDLNGSAINVISHINFIAGRRQGSTPLRAIYNGSAANLGNCTFTGYDVAVDGGQHLLTPLGCTFRSNQVAVRANLTGDQAGHYLNALPWSSNIFLSNGTAIQIRALGPMSPFVIRIQDNDFRGNSTDLDISAPGEYFFYRNYFSSTASGLTEGSLRTPVVKLGQNVILHPYPARRKSITHPGRELLLGEENIILKSEAGRLALLVSSLAGHHLEIIQQEKDQARVALGSISFEEEFVPAGDRAGLASLMDDEPATAEPTFTPTMDVVRTENQITVTMPAIPEGIVPMITVACPGWTWASIVHGGEAVDVWGFEDEKVSFPAAQAGDYVLTPTDDRPQTCTVTFDSDGGSTVKSQMVVQGSRARLPAAPSKEGYLFSRWQLEGQNYDFTTPVTQSIRLKAVWTPKPVQAISEEKTTVVTDQNGKVQAVIAAQDAASGQPILLPMAPVTAAEVIAWAPIVEVTLPTGGKRPVTVEIPVEEARESDVLVLVDGDGGEEVFPSTALTERGLAVTLYESALLKVVRRAGDYTDLPSRVWVESAVAFTTSRGLFFGVGEGRFAPGKTMNRAMAACVLHRLACQPETDAPPFFTDVPQGRWYTKAIAWAHDKGIVAGYGDRFGVGEPVTREQLMAMLWRLAGKPAVEPVETGASPWAAEAMSWAVTTGILAGDGEGYKPQGEATRAQCAAFLMRFINQFYQALALSRTKA